MDDLEYLKNAIEASPEEYYAHLEKLKELLTPEEYALLYQEEQNIDANCEEVGC